MKITAYVATDGLLHAWTNPAGRGHPMCGADVTPDWDRSRDRGRMCWCVNESRADPRCPKCHGTGMLAAGGDEPWADGCWVCMDTVDDTVHR
jgi:hypothetical protein